MQKVIFIARQEFPADQTMFAEAALETSPENMDLIRDAFMTDSESMESALTEADKANKLVDLPPEARALDDDLREAIARMTAKVEGKYWPEQEVAKEDFSFKHRDEVRVSRESYGADETSLENSVPVDTEDERKITTSQLRINDHWEREMKLQLDESKFDTQAQGDSKIMREARKKEISPAGAVGFPERPYIKRSSYYIPPAKGDYRSTIDLNDEERPELIIRRPSAFRSIPSTDEEFK